MTFASLFADLQKLALFLLAGYLLREFVRPLQKLYLPSAVLGGAIALIGGQQVLGLWEVPAVFSTFSGTLIVLIMTCLVWGVKIDKKRVAGYVDYICFLNVMRFAQIGVGALTGILLRKVWTELPVGWGTMAVSAYFGGHGTVASYAGVFESLGYGTDYAGIGMVMATLGLLAAVVVGMIFVNIYVRKGEAKYVKNEAGLGAYEERRLIPKEKRGSLGTIKVPGGSINALAFQLAMLLVVAWFGKNVLKLLGVYVWSGFGKLPNMMYGIVGAVIIWPIMSKLKLEDYVDRKTCNQISGCALEILICGSIATMDLQIVTKLFMPIMIQFIIMVSLTAFICFWYNKRIAEDEWLEKSLFVFGQSTGATPTGLALVRAVDPDAQSCAAEAHAVQSGTVGVCVSWIPALLPALATSAMPWSEVGFGLAIALVIAVIGWLLFRKKVKALGR